MRGKSRSSGKFSFFRISETLRKTLSPVRWRIESLRRRKSLLCISRDHLCSRRPAWTLSIAQHCFGVRKSISRLLLRRP